MEQSLWLNDLLMQTLFPLEGLLRELEKHDPDDEGLLGVLKTLVDAARANLNLIGEILIESFGGEIKVETVNLDVYGLFLRVNFGKAFIYPPEPQAAAQGGAA